MGIEDGKMESSKEERGEQSGEVGRD